MFRCKRMRRVGSCILSLFKECPFIGRPCLLDGVSGNTKWIQHGTSGTVFVFANNKIKIVRVFCLRMILAATGGQKRALPIRLKLIRPNVSLLVRD